MRKTVFELLKEIGTELQLVSDQSITSFTDSNLRAELLYYLNRAKDWALSDVTIDSLMESTVIQTVAAYSTGTVSISQGGTTVSGTSTVFTSAMEGRKIRIGGSQANYKIAKFRDATTLELEKPYADTSVTDGTYNIFQDVYCLPPDVRNVSAILRQNFRRTLMKKPVAFLISRYPDPTMSTSQPFFWGEFGVKETREPSTGTYTAEASTSTTDIIDTTNLNNAIYNYYKDWEVYNSTRSATADVKGYDQNSQTLTIDPAITGQAVGDSYFLRKREVQIMIRPISYSAIPFTVIYKKYPKPFVNDTDYETEIPEDFESMLIHEAINQYYMTKAPEKGMPHHAAAQQFLDQWKDILEDMPMSKLAFGGGGAIPSQEAWANVGGDVVFNWNSPY